MMQYQQHHRQNPSSSSNNNNSNTNTSRRTFRGRGGATDRQHLPKYNTARQRRHENHNHHHDESDESNRINNNNNIDHENDTINNIIIDNDDGDDDENDVELYRLEVIDPFVTVVPIPRVADDSFVTNPVVHTSGRSRNDDSITQHMDDNPNDEKSLLQKEIQHITRRIRLLRQNWSKSKTGIIIVSTYQTNVIQASLNIIMKEWLSILRQYHIIPRTPPHVDRTTNITNRNDMDSMDAMDDGNDNVTQQQQQQEEVEVEERTLLLRPVSHEIFLLIQHSIQCGPLTGSQPGYFKRCGSHVAHIVYHYLHTILPMTIQNDYTTTPTPTNNTTSSMNERESNADHPSNCHDRTSDDDDDDEEEEEEEDEEKEEEETAASDPEEHDTAILRHEQQHSMDSQTPKEQQNENNDSNNDDTITVTYYFTEAQIKTLQTWKQKAYNAAMISTTTDTTLDCKGSSNTKSNKVVPSKSMIQKEYQAQQIQKEKKRIKAMKGR